MLLNKGMYQQKHYNTFKVNSYCFNYNKGYRINKKFISETNKRNLSVIGMLCM